MTINVTIKNDSMPGTGKVVLVWQPNSGVATDVAKKQGLQLQPGESQTFTLWTNNPLTLEESSG